MKTIHGTARRCVSRSLALTLCLCLAVPLDARQAPQKPASAIATPIQAAADSLTRQLRGSDAAMSRAALADRLEMTLEELQRATSRLPRDTFDAASIVTRVGSDAEALLAWVRDETTHVAYRGVLRGPVGVLMDRVGNSLDRSLLLADLVGRAGGVVRLAHATLTPERVDALAAALSRRGGPARERPGPVDPDQEAFARAYAAKFGGDATAHVTRLSALHAATDAARLDLARRADAQSVLLLRAAGSAIGPAPATFDSAERADLADHWWVQVQSPSGWVNLDPAGVVPLSGNGTVTADRTATAGALDASLRHQVTLRVLITCLRANRLEERVVLEYTGSPGSLIGVPIRLSHIPAGGAPPDPALITAGDPGPGLAHWLTTQSEWLPVLAVGSEQLAAQRFNRLGEVLPAEPASGGTAGLLDAFGGDEPSSGGPGVLAGEFLEYEIHVPGGRNRVERRVLFDWSSPTGDSVTRDWADGALDLMSETEILVLGAEPSPEYVAQQTAESALRSRAELLRALRAPSGSARQAAGPEAAPEPLLLLYQFALSRRAWSAVGSQTFLSEPNILTRHLGLARDADGGTRRWTALDIVSNRVGVLPSAHRERRVVRVRQGVLDTNLEVLFDADDLTEPDAASANVSEAMVKGVEIGRVLSTGQPPNALIHAAVSTGNLVFAVPGGSSWWQIDPDSGTTLGRTARGWGGTSGAETAKTTALTATNSMRITARYFLTLLCVSQVALKHVAQMVRAKQAAQHGAPDAAGDLAPSSGGTALGIVLCVAGHALSGIGTYLGGTRGAPWSLAGDVVSVVMALWSVAATYDALMSML